MCDRVVDPCPYVRFTIRPGTRFPMNHRQDLPNGEDLVIEKKG